MKHSTIMMYKQTTVSDIIVAYVCKCVCIFDHLITTNWFTLEIRAFQVKIADEY